MGKPPGSVKEARPKGPFKPKPKVSDGKFKKGKVLKRSELITQKEKEKMQHKYNKAMRKERNPKLQPMKPASALEVAIKKEEEMRRFVGEGGRGSGEAARRLGKGQREAKALTANKRAVQEYEERRREKQMAREEAEKVREEKANAIKNYKKNRKDKFKGLVTGKSKTGQMLMGNQVDNLLKKIVQNKNK